MVEMDYTLDSITQVVSIFDIPKAFGIDINGFLTLILGSIIVGYICLTFHYKIYFNNQRWAELDYFEKAIVSLVVGFLSILVSIYAVTVYKYIIFQNNNIEQLDQLFLQLKYIAPFLYFIGFSAIAAKYDYRELDFIKKYIRISFGLIVSLNFAFMLIIFYIIKSWAGFIWIFSIILMVVIAYKFQKLMEYLSRLMPDGVKQIDRNTKQP